MRFLQDNHMPVLREQGVLERPIRVVGQINSRSTGVRELQQVDKASYLQPDLGIFPMGTIIKSWRKMTLVVPGDILTQWNSRDINQATIKHNTESICSR